MKIKFLGTSAGWPLPRLGCNCIICSSKNPLDVRTRSQALINDTLLLDIGPDTYHHLHNAHIDTKKIKYAAISHEHPDHTFGLWDLGHTYGAEKINIIIHPNTYKKIKSLFFYKEYNQVLLSESETIPAGDLEVSLLPVQHTDSSFGVLVQKNAKKLFWAPDFKTFPQETKKMLLGVDLLAIDGSELKIKMPSHETIEEGIELGKEIKAKSVYFIHIGHRALPHKELEAFVQKKGGNNFHIAYDSLEVAI